MIYILNENVVVENMDANENIVFDLNGTEIFRCNDMTAYILDLFRTTMSLGNILMELKNVFLINNEEDIEKDIREIIKSLSDNNIIKEIDKYIISDDYNLREEDDYFICYHIPTAEIFALNEVSYIILKNMEKGYTIDEILNDLVKKYECDEEVISKDFSDYMNILIKNGIIRGDIDEET